MKNFKEGQSVFLTEDLSPNWLKGDSGIIYYSKDGNFRLKDDEGHNTEQFEAKFQKSLISATVLA